MKFFQIIVFFANVKKINNYSGFYLLMFNTENKELCDLLKKIFIPTLLILGLFGNVISIIIFNKKSDFNQHPPLIRLRFHHQIWIHWILNRQ